MAFGIEARVPFLDHRLVEAALLLPDRLRVGRDGLQKVALRRAMAGIVPAAVLQRRDKIAFGAPQAKWLAGAQRTLSQLPVRRLAEQAGFVRDRQTSSAFEGLFSLPDPWVWRVLAIEMWLRVVWAGHPDRAPS